MQRLQDHIRARLLPRRPGINRVPAQAIGALLGRLSWRSIQMKSIGGNIGVPLHGILGEDYRDNRGERVRRYRDKQGAG